MSSSGSGAMWDSWCWWSIMVMVKMSIGMVMNHDDDGWWYYVAIGWAKKTKTTNHDEVSEIYQVVYEYEKLNQHRNKWCFAWEEVGVVQWNIHDGYDDNMHMDGKPWCWKWMRTLWCAWMRENNKDNESMINLVHVQLSWLQLNTHKLTVCA